MPGAFLVRRRLISVSICLGVNILMFGVVARSVSRYSETEAEWWQVCSEAWVRGKRKVSQVLGAFELLDFNILRPVLARREFLNLRTVYFFKFPIFWGWRGEGEGGPRPPADIESPNTAVQLYLQSIRSSEG